MSSVMNDNDRGASPLLPDADQCLPDYQPGLRISEVGSVASVGDGVAWVSGLPSAAMDELLDFADGSTGLVFRLGKDRIGVILLYQTDALTAGTIAHRSGRSLVIPVGEALLGRVIDPLGAPLDGQPAPECRKELPLDVLSPPIVHRDFVHDPLYSGNKIVDTLIPIGKGQRQLLIGDDGVGKSALALDTVINQSGKDVYCVYILVGQKRSTAVDIIETLRYSGALEHTTVVIAEATALPGLKYLAPFAGCTVAESWMQQGKDTLVVFDDLSTHAQTYRELSLLLRRPPGREAYPGDIFYLHARLLERATCLSAEAGGGTLTALPIVETKEGDIASYIPTNLISITDGQIYFDKALFSSGILPAIDVTKSVSRIGGAAQHPRIKEEAGHMKLDYLQFLELETFTRFGTRLDPAVEHKIQHGRLLREILKQDRLTPLPVEVQMAWLVAYNEGLLDGVEIPRIHRYLDQLAARLKESEARLEDSREQWLANVKEWLAGMEDSHPT
jgi:F-type H+-transporting ATPase subunit alpha